MFLIDGEPQQHHEATLAIFEAVDENDKPTGDYLVQIQDDQGAIVASIVVGMENFKRRWTYEMEHPA